MAPLVLLNLDLTYRCNKNCEHCGSGGGFAAHREGFIATDDALRLIREASELGCRDVTLAGGEPLLHEGIFDVLDEIGQRRMRAGLLTNGTCLDGDVVQFLSHCPGVGYVRVSIGCVDGVLHDADEGGYAPASVITAVRSLVRSGISVGVSMTVTPSNADAISDVIGLAADLGVDFVRVVPVVPVGMAARWEVSEDFWAQVLRSAIAALMQHGIATSLDYARLPSSVQEFAAAFSGPCVAGTLSCTIEPDGRAMPCPLMGDESSTAVDWRERPLAAVWEELQRRTAMLRQSLGAGSGRCSGCGMSARCIEGCLAEKKARHVSSGEGQPICISAVVERACRELFQDRAARRIMSGMLARQLAHHAMGLHPCVRSSPLWLHPLVDVRREGTAWGASRPSMGVAESSTSAEPIV